MYLQFPIGLARLAQAIIPRVNVPLHTRRPKKHALGSLVSPNAVKLLNNIIVLVLVGVVSRDSERSDR